MLGSGVRGMTQNTNRGQRPPSPRFPYRAWSAYARETVPLVTPPDPDRLRGREYDEVDQ